MPPSSLKGETDLMSVQRSPTLTLRARGSLACFTRPELKVERVSYPVMTPSAARGLVEAVLWKPAIRWHIERIRVLREIRFVAFRRNEVATKASAPARAVIDEGGTVSPYFADSDRAQRNTVALRDVDYLIDAHFTLTDRAGAEDNVNKFLDMFRRRLERGQHFHQPYLGCREFAADVLPPDGTETPIDDTRDLGLMLWDIDFDSAASRPESPRASSGRASSGRASSGGSCRPLFFAARLEAGVLEVPGEAQILTAMGGGR